MRNVWRIRNPRKKKLEDIILKARRSDIIFLNPGEYNLVNAIDINDLTIVGTGNRPSDVIINGFFTVKNQSTLSLRNLTVQSRHKSNAMTAKDGSTLTLEKVIIKGELTEKFPAIWCEGSTLNLHRSEVYFSKKNSDSIYLKDNSEANIKNSVVDSLSAGQSTVNLHQSQVRAGLSFWENTIVNSTGMIDFLGLEDLYDIYMDQGARASFELINVDQAYLAFKVNESVLSVEGTEVAEDLSIQAYKCEKSTVHITGDEARVSIQDESGVKQTVTAQVEETAATKTETKADEDYKAEDVNLQADENASENKDDLAAEDELKPEKSGLEELHELFGLHGLKEQIDKFINTVKFNKSRQEQGLKTTTLTLHSLFMGNPGTGKTTVARLLGRVLYETGVISTNNFIEVTRKDLVSEYIGQTAKLTNDILEKSKGGILFIDEAYSLYSDSKSDFGREAIDTIITFMEDNRDNTMIIFAGYTDDMNNFLSMNSGLQSRIPNTFYFDDYSPEEIAEIGYTNILKEQYLVDESKYKEVISRLYSQSIDKSNARWVRNINEKLIQAMANRVIETGCDDAETIIETDFEVFTGNQHIDKDEKMTELLAELDSLIGLDSVKSYVHNLIKQVEVDKLLLEDGLTAEKPSYHMIFAGNPGTGKTTVATIIAELFYHLDILPKPTVKTVDRSDLVGSYIGHTEKQTKQIIEQSMGGVLFIDEAYQLSSGSGKDFGKQAIETLLTYLENYRDKFIVILAGYTDEMEQFLRTNPGLRSRIPLEIDFPDYSPEEVATIVEKIVTQNWEVDRGLLRNRVMAVYEALPENEKANGRWARNYSERLIANHKVWISEQAGPVENLRKISRDVIEAM